MDVDEARIQFVEALDMMLKQTPRQPQGLADAAAWERYEKTCRERRREVVVAVKQLLVDVMDLLEQEPEEVPIVEADRAVENWLRAVEQ